MFIPKLTPKTGLTASFETVKLTASVYVFEYNELGRSETGSGSASYVSQRSSCVKQRGKLLSQAAKQAVD